MTAAEKNAMHWAIGWLAFHKQRRKILASRQSGGVNTTHR